MKSTKGADVATPAASYGRHIDKGHGLLCWANEIEVVCPKCGEHGVLKGNGRQGSFTCLACAYRAQSDTTGWVGEVEAAGRRRCPACGTKWITVSKTYASATNATQDLMGTCPNCSEQSHVQVTLWPSKPYDHSVDPFLGLELALKENTRHGAVWVYNASHLAELKAFLAASIREDYDQGSSYFSRLPTWMKAAKNRDDVLKAVGRLEKRARTTVHPPSPHTA